MLKKIADKAGSEMAITDQNGLAKSFKLLNNAYLGIRKLHTDQQGVATYESNILAGDILRTEHGTYLTVSVLTLDYYRGQVIRRWLDLVDSNNFVSVYRPTVISNGQGGITGKTEELIHENIPVKIGTVSLTVADDLDTTRSLFGMLLSSHYPVKMGDILKFATHYETAKVDGIKLNYDGVFEIAFDKEPRWI